MMYAGDEYLAADDDAFGPFDESCAQCMAGPGEECHPACICHDCTGE